MQKQQKHVPLRFFSENNLASWADALLLKNTVYNLASRDHNLIPIAPRVIHFITEPRNAFVTPFNFELICKKTVSFKIVILIYV